MIVSIIAAMDRNHGIGAENKLPWKLSADLKRFRELTMGHHIVMGRKTYESIGKPLPGRQTIIITRNSDYKVEGGDVVHSIEDAIRLAEPRSESELFICGGGEIYSQSLDLADKMYLTFVDAEVETDTRFPEWNKDEWDEIKSEHYIADEKNQYSFDFKLFHKSS